METRRDLRRLRPGRILAQAAIAILALVSAGCSSADGHRHAAPAASSRPAETTTRPVDPDPSNDTAGSAAATLAGTPAVRTAELAERRHRRTAARSAIARLTAHLGRDGVSVAAFDVRTGASFHYGARGGMNSGSIAKLFILETLLLQHQRAGTDLDENEVDLATRMIENSDNEAADALDEAIGEGPAMARAAGPLGVRHTRYGAGILWGFNETSAADYIALLRNLVEPRALHRDARAFVLGLMADTESDQRWGVSAAADRGTLTRQKNGWLAVAKDDDRWLVNSTGIITAHGDRVLIAVLTQHGDGYDSGVALTEKLARITVRALSR